MKAGWTSLGQAASPERPTGTDPWAGGSWQYSDETSRPAPAAGPAAATRPIAPGGAAGAPGTASDGTTRFLATG
ncbi:hypothetical protein DY240_22800, partial [Jiangella rhizosphaerae]